MDALFEPWSREVITRAKVWRGDKVLDAACGTGVVACRIAATGAAVTGLEPDGERLEAAKRRASEESVPVTWVAGELPSPRLKPASFDLVTCLQGLQHARDRAVMVREMRKLIAPGGRAVVACWAGTIDPAALTALLNGAKFFAVTVERVTRVVRVPEALVDAVRAEVGEVAVQPAGELVEVTTASLVAVARVPAVP